MAEPFIGEIRIFGFNFAPRGWAFCDGQLLPIAQNTALFSIMGTNFGGDGESTLGLPNFQDRVPIHQGEGPGLTPRGLGEKGGTTTETLSLAQIPNHSHTPVNAAKFPAAGDTNNPGSNSYFAQFAGGNGYAAPGTTVSMAQEMCSTTGGGQAHTNMQPHQVLNFCIALVGIYE